MPEEPYQVMPEHSPESYEALKEDIRNRGIKTPITIDEHGKIIDGHTRIKIYEELLEEGEDIAYPPTTIVRTLSDAVQKRTAARKENSLRRHLTSAQKRTLVIDQLKDTPRWDNARIARVVGVKRDMVRGIREELEESDRNFPYIDQLEMESGQLTPSRKESKKNLSGAAKTAHETKLAKKAAESLGGGHRGPPQTQPDSLTQTVGEAFTSGAIPGNEPLPAPNLTRAQRMFHDLRKHYNPMLSVDAEEVAAECSDPDDAQARMQDATRVIAWFENYSEALAKTARRDMTAIAGGRSN